MGQPLFPGLIRELGNIVGVLSQFDIERAVVLAASQARAKRSSNSG
jgi:hypothetical protein